jgi:hypothetical protein
VSNAKEQQAMLKMSVVAAFLAIVALSPAYAAQDLCNEAHMKQMDGMIAKMTDATKQKEATAALDMSKAAMKKGDTAGCMKQSSRFTRARGDYAPLRPLIQKGALDFAMWSATDLTQVVLAGYS